MKNLFYVLIVCLFFTSINCNADQWAERERLASLVEKINDLEKEINFHLANETEKTSSRTRFNYQVLLGDLEKIRTGILHHLMAPMEPSVPSLTDALSTSYTVHHK